MQNRYRYKPSWNLTKNSKDEILKGILLMVIVFTIVFFAFSIYFVYTGDCQIIEQLEPGRSDCSTDDECENGIYVFESDEEREAFMSDPSFKGDAL